MANFQNLHLADRTFYLNYRTLFKTDISGAHEILEESDLNNKVLGASEMNDITDRINDIETYYSDNVPVKLNDYITNFDGDISRLTYVGDYSSSSTYYFNNIVSYNSQLYYCKIASGEAISNIAPTNTSYWVYLGLRGEKGAAGLGIVLKSQWDSATSYSAKDVVAYNNYLYVATDASTNQVPSSNSEYWILLMDYQVSKITTDENNVNISDIYMQEV